MAEPTEVTIAETNQGRLVLRGNELILYDMTIGDPVAIRFRSNNETKGKHSIDKFVNGAQRELGFIGYKEDERGRTDPAHRDALEVTYWTHKPGHGFEDPDYERMFAIRHDGVVFYKGAGPVAISPSSYIRSQNGFFEVHQQGDGNLVLYDVRTSPWTPLWASGTVVA